MKSKVGFLLFIWRFRMVYEMIWILIFLRLGKCLRDVRYICGVWIVGGFWVGWLIGSIVEKRSMLLCSFILVRVKMRLVLRRVLLWR